ncbi:MAG: BspA family leucine-rich repeat surface protein [Bacteroidales bacterium]|nr:BspA family leucine-rich repeat surface protein [Bacteroidales bacterium]
MNKLPGLILVLLFITAKQCPAQEIPTFYLDENGITIKCKNCQPGDTGLVNGIRYEAVDRELLDKRKDEGANLIVICTSLVTEMDSLFYRMDDFNQDIGSWDVSSVTDMCHMFNYAASFNQDIGAWNVSNVTDMSHMFYDADAFNQDIEAWDVGRVTKMDYMFSFATTFNKDIGLWDVGNVTDMSAMFRAAKSFNQDISIWCVENINIEPEDFAGGCPLQSDFFPEWGEPCIPYFYLDENGTTIKCEKCQPGDTGTVNSILYEAVNRKLLEQRRDEGADLTILCTSPVTNMSQMFYGNWQFNQDIKSWDVSNVTDMSEMFAKAESFNQNISVWCVEKIDREPKDFATDCPLASVFFPKWGTCPSSYARYIIFPDKYFLSALIKEGVDTNEDGFISYSEAENVKKLNISNGNISDLSGIERFTLLDSINCCDNNLSNIDILNYKSFSYIDCHGNDLTELNITNGNYLTYLDCSKNSLDTLNITGFTSLQTLYCYNNHLTSLNVSQNDSLKILLCGINQLTSLDVSQNSKLNYLNCNINQLTNLEVSNNTELVRLLCYDNALTILDVTQNTDLAVLDCSSNKLAGLDVTNNPLLVVLDCQHNAITELDLTNNAWLGHLDCSANLLTSLDICNNTDLMIDQNPDYTYGFNLLLMDMPTLTEVIVWELPFPPEGRKEKYSATGSDNIVFENCNDTSNIVGIYSEAGVRIYPNPNDGTFTIELAHSVQTDIEIFSIAGRVIYRKEHNKTAEQVDLSQYSRGIYFVSVRSSAWVRTEKIVKY